MNQPLSPCPEEDDEGDGDPTNELKREIIMLSIKLEKVKSVHETACDMWTADRDNIILQESVLFQKLEESEKQQLDLATRNEHLRSQLTSARLELEELRLSPPTHVMETETTPNSLTEEFLIQLEDEKRVLLGENQSLRETVKELAAYIVGPSNDAGSHIASVTSRVQLEAPTRDCLQSEDAWAAERAALLDSNLQLRTRVCQLESTLSSGSHREEERTAERTSLQDYTVTEHPAVSNRLTPVLSNEIEGVESSPKPNPVPKKPKTKPNPVPKTTSKSPGPPSSSRILPQVMQPSRNPKSCA